MLKQMHKSISVLACVVLCNCTQREIVPRMESLSSPTRSLLQAISIVDENTIWVSGHDATFVCTHNGGNDWELFMHPTGDTLQFRDIYAINDKRAILLSAGPGPLSRIFTFEAPDLWEENFVMKDSLGFLDCIDFWDEQRGIAYGDAIDQYPYILLTQDGGRSWQRTDTVNMPKAGNGEGGFSASGTCVVTGENGTAWIATGAGGNSRFLITEDFGKSWKTVDSPIVKGEVAGNTSVSFTDMTGFVVGGDLLQTDAYTDNYAFSTNGGEAWSVNNPPKTKGAFYGGAITQVGDQYFAFACGPNGLDYTSDFGIGWKTLDTLNYWAVSFHENIGYACGTDGKILKISLR